jgi:2-polyprenyl-3-methyl-5-hydroxy-6-metoxy-1,4-benzoquinol methylase
MTGASRDEQQRAALRDLVRRGYDAISEQYRSDDGLSNPGSTETTSPYGAWVAELAELVPPGGRVLDLGCGAGVPMSRDLVDRGFDVMGVDISEVQVARARSLVPGGTFAAADMATWDAEPGSFDAVVSLYALIHVPLEDQRALIPRIRRWLRPGGHFLAIIGVGEWTGVEDYFGTEMFWDHADRDAYLAWFADAGFETVWHRFVPEGDVGHTLVLAQAQA